jgi:hypothetical protein
VDVEPLLGSFLATSSGPVTGSWLEAFARAGSTIDEQANPFRGVTGTCRPKNDRPYPMRGNYRGG